METFLGLCGLSEKVIVGGIWRLCALDKKWFSQHALNTATRPRPRDAHDMPYTRALFTHMLSSLLLAQPLIIVGKLRTRDSELVSNSNPVFEVLLR